MKGLEIETDWNNFQHLHFLFIFIYYLSIIYIILCRFQYYFNIFNNNN